MKAVSPKTDASPSRLQTMLDRLAQKNAQKRAKANETGSSGELRAKDSAATTRSDAGKSDASAVEDVFGATPSANAVIGSSSSTFRPGDKTGRSSGGGMLGARVAALSGDLSATGRVFHGDLKISNAADLVGLNGIRAITGELVIAESDLDAGALAPLRFVEEVGSLALEGNHKLTALDALCNLKTVEERLYIGFNASLNTASLPALTSVGGALVVEGNPVLTTAAFDALADVGRYFHASENEKLVSIGLPALGSLDELVLQDNPNLTELLAMQLKAPADVEVVGSKHLALADNWATG